MRYLDLAVIAVYLVGITWFGARFRRTQRTLKDYFLGGRAAPWWAIALSIVSAETSTLTIIGTPALAFAGNLGFLQVVFGYLLGRLVISAVFLPHYFRGELYTAYELIGRRFGQRARRLTAGTFLVLRALAEGVRVFAISMVVSIVLGTGELASITLIVCLTLFYTFEGGMTAVIWTDVVQMFLYVAGAIVSFSVILAHVPGGWGEVWSVTAAAGKLQLFDFRFAFTPEFFSRTYSFWAGLIGGCFLTTASHGTEQLLVQRLLAARSQRESRAALLGSWVVIFIQFSLFLFIGLALYVFYTGAGLPAPQPADRIYPEFVWRYLPPGVAGLVVAAILAAAMSNLSAALNSLASTSIMDFYKPLVEGLSKKPGDTPASGWGATTSPNEPGVSPVFSEGLSKKPGDTPASCWGATTSPNEPGVSPVFSEGHYLRMARAATIVWGVVLLAIGYLARKWGSVLETGLSIASVIYGALLGVFLLGVLTRRVGEKAAMAGMAAGLIAMAAVKLYTSVAWTWYVLIGTTVTFTAGCLASLFQSREARG